MTRYCLLLAVSLTAFAQEPLSLREAVSRALAAHPALVAETERVTVSEGLRRQAGLRPNPTASLQTESIRTHGTPGFVFPRDADTYAYLTQPFEMGGKRQRRVDVAEANLRRSQLQRELTVHQIGSRVTTAYWNAVGAQRIYELLLENQKNFQKIIDYHELRVKEGAMAEADLLRVRLEGEQLAISANSAALTAERSRIALFREMGGTEFPKVHFTERLEDVDEPLLVVELERALEDRPEMRIARQALGQATSNVALEKAMSKPDLDVLFGYKRGGGFNTLIGGVEFDLPLSNRNQGNIAAATAEMRVAESSLAATEALVRAEIDAARTEYEMRRRQVHELLRTLLDNAAESSQIAVASYREGGTDLLRLLDAERVRIDVQSLYYRSLVEYKQSRAALETAMGVAP